MPRTIVILAMQDVQSLDVSGPLDVFVEANFQSGWGACGLRIVAGGAGADSQFLRVRLIPDHIVGPAMAEPIDTLLVAGSPNAGVVRPVSWWRQRRAGLPTGSYARPACRRTSAFCAEEDEIIEIAEFRLRLRRGVRCRNRHWPDQSRPTAPKTRNPSLRSR
jgi:hypothetical protein